MYLYVNTVGKGITEDLEQAARVLFADNYCVEFVDLQRRPLCPTAIRLPQSKKNKEKELEELSSIVDEKFHVFDGRLNVTGVQASYKVVDSCEENVPCVTVFVLGKGKIPLGESEMDGSLLDVKLDIVEGYPQPCDSSYKSYASPLFGGVGIGIEKSKKAGTIGGFFMDENENEKRYLLTCEHVLRPPGVKDPRSKVVQPAEIDFKEELAEAEAAVAAHKKRLKKQKEKLKYCRPEKLGRYNDRVTKTLKKLKKVQREKKDLEDLEPRSIGSYVCGFRGNELIEIDANKHLRVHVDAAIAELCEDEVSEIEAEKGDESEDECCPLYGFKNNNAGFSPTGRILDLSELSDVPVNRLMKIGRTTRLTGDGRLSKTKMLIKYIPSSQGMCAGNLRNVPFEIYCNSCREVTDENQVDMNCILEIRCHSCNRKIEKQTLDSSVEWAQNCMVIERPEESFCKAGDSGALVFDNKGRALGMVFALFNFNDASVPYSLASPLSATLQVLEKISGKKLKLW